MTIKIEYNLYVVIKSFWIIRKSDLEAGCGEKQTKSYFSLCLDFFYVPWCIILQHTTILRKSNDCSPDRFPFVS